MSTLKETAPTPSGGLTEADYQPVATLVNELRRQQSLGSNVVTWMNAFTVFKMIERRAELPPASEYERYAYLAIISELKAAGYRLLVQMGEQAGEICGHADTSVEAFKACVYYLELADRMVALDNDPETIGKLDALFAAP
ncbi:MAG: hypothetical protein LBM04_01905 [Opitutaceae bacterium]|jgi:hypothetical protein|nr:hypothetical protein [Opitutaceae bacterium]